ncbi:MAG: VWA domain-containing protein [Archangiaceae bacterium]|nr:VWA domain-containing protein [Archangiaceae bacterium]
MNRTHLILASAFALVFAALFAPRLVAAPALVSSPPERVAAKLPTRPIVATNGASGLDLTVRPSQTKVQVGDRKLYVKVDLGAPHLERRAERLPVNLAVAIDRSGSMKGDKMLQAHRAAHALVDALRPGDRLALVAFDDSMATLPSAPIDADTAKRAHAFIDGITDRGSTNMSGALAAAYAQLAVAARDYRVSRAVLLSDGQPTVGLTSPEALTQSVERARQQHLTTSTFGVGLDFNAPLMRDLANAGAGATSFIENAANLGEAFSAELEGASQLVAREVMVLLTPQPGSAIEDVPGHDFRRQPDGTVAVRLYDLSAGQTAQLLVRLSTHYTEGGTAQPLQVHVDFTNVQRNTHGLEAKAVGISVVDDAETAAASVDPVVDEMVRRVDVSDRLVEAQSAYQSGDTTRALGMLDDIRGLFGSSADALAGEDLANVESSWKAGGSAAARMDQNLTRKTMKNFGQNNAMSY